MNARRFAYRACNKSMPRCSGMLSEDSSEVKADDAAEASVSAWTNVYHYHEIANTLVNAQRLML